MSTASSDVEEEVSAPVVFQCFKCNLVVGDSFAFRCADRDRQTITLSAASNITRTSDIYTSSSKFDYGSTYITFNCLGCENTLGKFYLTTSRDVDNLREAFTFDTKNVCSYELGKARHKREASYDTDLGAQNSKILEKLELVQQSVRDMETEIRKIQHVMCGLDNRVSLLEGTPQVYSNSNSV